MHSVAYVRPRVCILIRMYVAPGHKNKKAEGVGECGMSQQRGRGLPLVIKAMLNLSQSVSQPDQYDYGSNGGKVTGGRCLEPCSERVSELRPD